MQKIDENNEISNIKNIRSLKKYKAKLRGKKRIPHSGPLYQANRNLRRLAKKHNAIGLKGRPISKKTQKQRYIILNSAIILLHEENAKIINLYKFRRKHLYILFEEWLDIELSPGSIINRLSVLRNFETWINKPGMTTSAIESFHRRDEFKQASIRLSNKELPDRSLTGNGIDFEIIINKLIDIDLFVAIQLFLQLIFGLRVEESMRFCPVNSDNGNTISVTEGTKGNRKREGVEPILLDKEAREFIDFLKKLVLHKYDQWMIPDGYTFEHWKSHFYNIVQKIGLTKKQLGVTPHSLRHEFAQIKNQQLCSEFLPMFEDKWENLLTPQQRKEALSRVSSMLGHSRTNISHIYGI